MLSGIIRKDSVHYGCYRQAFFMVKSGCCGPMVRTFRPYTPVERGCGDWNRGGKGLETGAGTAEFPFSEPTDKASPHPEERHRFFMETAAILHGKSSNSPQKLHCIFRNTTLFYQEHKPVSSRRTATFHHGYCNFPPRILQLSATDTTSFHHGNSNILPRNINIL